uniref:Molybdopterin synthase catalytic subunit n=2 Tax=Octactis speculum TaxID=3111310 RepID=A0A7S2D574_9STRA|mmetsp:Transcript_43525/g.59442  ORF Transcript_43525/g.59442 Transcript_43525/m.59442 type:complete len:115 (+) Transcript_43525:298-642(+)
MAEKEMESICKQIRERWEVEHIAMEHRLGICPIQEASVLIAVSSAHRKEALEAAQYAIDTLKSSVPIWKKEFYETDDSSAVWKENKEWAGGSLIGGAQILEDAATSSSSDSQLA